MAALDQALDITLWLGVGSLILMGMMWYRSKTVIVHGIDTRSRAPAKQWRKKPDADGHVTIKYQGDRLDIPLHPAFGRSYGSSTIYYVDLISGQCMEWGQPPRYYHPYTGEVSDVPGTRTVDGVEMPFRYTGPKWLHEAKTDTRAEQIMQAAQGKFGWVMQLVPWGFALIFIALVIIGFMVYKLSGQLGAAPPAGA